ncbi:MAG: dephospho-CoA kinase [Planctomycetota bacterium]|nr:dephospho-CoA kinase [Planctomycetota bacterium]
MTGAPVAIGLVGQVCAGKSAVAEAFKKRGAALYEADKLVHGLYARPDVKEDVRTLFGDEVFDARGEVDRKKIGAVVFADAAKLKELTEQVLFPRTGEILRAALDALRAGTLEGHPPALLIDAPTLFEAGREGWCDKLLFVAAPRDRRERWAKEKRGWAAGEIERREARMQDESLKRARCDAVLDNDGSLEDLDRKVGELWTAWVSGRTP